MKCSLFFSFLILFAVGDGSGAELKEARVTAVIKDVKLLPGQAEPKPAAVDDTVAGDTAVRTGVDSRSELTFADLTIARLGANTIFSFDKGSRTVDLGGGAILLRVPKNSGGAKINTAAVTAAITGTTMMAEYHAANAQLRGLDAKGSFKFVMLEGSSRICQPVIDPVTHRKTDNPPQCVDLGPGQMLIGKPGGPLGTPVDVDLKQLVTTSLLTNGFGPLGSEDLIQQEILAQLDAKANGTVVDTRLTHFGDPTSQDVIDQKTAASETPTPTPEPTSTPTPTPFPTPTPTPTPVPTPTPTPTPVPTPTPTPTPVPTPTPTPTPVPTPTPTPTPVPTPTPTPTPVPTPTPTPTPVPTPSKFGTPPVITSSVPYVIDNTTAISTDPVITKPGATDYGTIYRDFATDGSRTNWLFGSTSAFDTHSGFEGGPDTSTYLNQIAVFKFEQLEIDGSPTISTANGVANLGLVGVDGISTGGNGATLSFSGISSLLLATENGSINLGAQVSFQNIDRMFIYARGGDVQLSINSNITTNNDLRLYSEGAVTIAGNVSTVNFSSFSGSSYFPGGGVITAAGTYITSDANITFNSDLFSPGGFTNTSLSLNAAVTLDITLQNSLSVFTAAASILAKGGNLNLFASAPTALDLSNATSAEFVATNGDLIGDNVDFLGSFISLHAPAGNIQIRSLNSTFVNDLPVLGGSVIASGSITATGNLESGLIHSITSKIDAGGLLLGTDISAGTDINGANGITAYGGSIFANGNITSSAGPIHLEQRPNGTFGNITAGGNISAAAGIFTPGDPVIVSAGGDITTPGLITGTLKAGGNIFIDNANGSLSGIGVIANGIYASGGQGLFYAGTLNLDNVPSIKPNNGSSVNHDGETFTDFTLQAGRIVSTGAARAILSSNGGNANPNFNDSNPGNGGNIFLGINVGGLAIGSGADLDSIVANGGAFNASGPFGGGNGGSILSGATGNVTINNAGDGSPGISATTGSFASPTSQHAGAGGTVKITAGGTIAVNGTVQVSSDDARIDGPSANRESASGGSIHLQSNLTTGAGITVGANGSLLSYLTLDALNSGGTPGSITLSTMGADIVVNGTVRADFGTITLDQNDPSGSTPLITLDGGVVQGATFNINGSGDLTIGPNNATAINIFGGTWNVAHDITINAANTSFAYGFMLSATAGNAINFTGGNANNIATISFPLSGDTTFSSGAGGINAQFVDIHYAGAGLNLITAGSVTANSIAYTDFFTRGTVQAGGSITTAGNLFEGDITAGTSISVGDSIQANTVNAGTTLNVTGSLQAGTVNAGGDVTAGSLEVQTFSAPNGILTAGIILPYVFSTDPSFPAQGAKAPHVITANTIASFNGIDFNGNRFDGIDGYTSGGILTINANQITSAIGDVNFNGADAGATDSNGNVFTTVGGDGGSLTINTSGDITIGNPIEATTGLVPQNDSPSGKGGTVNLNSTSGTIAINERIEVSSNDAAASPTPSPPPRRRSAQGGNISLTSGKSAPAGSRAVAINVSSSGQLLSLLAAAPTPRPGGKVTILATGANSDVNISGPVRADGGTIDIRNQGDAGHVNITGPVSNVNGFNNTLSADVIKAGAFGANGQLNIGRSTLSADTLIRLYAPGSNGELIFVANTTLSSGSRIDLAASKITINPGFVVTITGNAGPANIYTGNANYAPGPLSPGGTNPNNGTFGGNGATRPQSLNAAPGFDSPPARPSGGKPGG